MKINFGRTTWHNLIKIRDTVRQNARNKYTEEVKIKIGASLADVIDAELKRREMLNEPFDGSFILSVEISIEADPLLPYNPGPKRNLLTELEDELEARRRAKKTKKPGANPISALIKY